MPCISTKVNIEIPAQKEEAIKRQFGKAIALLPGKSEQWLMLTFARETIYFQGEKDAPAAFVEVKLFGLAAPGATEKLTAELTGILHRELGIAPARIYIRYDETKYWGFNGRNL